MINRKQRRESEPTAPKRASAANAGKRKKIKEAAKSLKFRLNEDEVNSAGAAQEAKGDDIGAFPKRPYFTSMIATQ